MKGIGVQAWGGDWLCENGAGVLEKVRSDARMALRAGEARNRRVVNIVRFVGGDGAWSLGSWKALVWETRLMMARRDFNFFCRQPSLSIYINDYNEHDDLVDPNCSVRVPNYVG